MEDDKCPEVCVFCDLKQRGELHHPIVYILQLMLFSLVLTDRQSSLDQFPSTAPLKILDHLRLGLVLMNDSMLMHELMVSLIESKINVLRLLSRGRPVVLMQEEGIIILGFLIGIPSLIILL